MGCEFAGTPSEVTDDPFNWLKLKFGFLTHHESSVPVKWKSPKRFKPALVISRIAATRTVGDDGRVSYAGLWSEDALPTLQSMLEFPPAASEVDTQTLVWRALSQAGRVLTPETFLAALNSGLSERLAVRESDYFVVTSMSANLQGLPRKITAQNCQIELREGSFPRKFLSRGKLIADQRMSIPNSPENYAKVIVKVKAKSERSAFHKAMKSLDLQRALLCMMGNARMQFSLGGTLSQEPINVIRLGSIHTVHRGSGVPVDNRFWYEPNFLPTKLHGFKKPEVVTKNLRWALRRIEKSKIQAPLVAALLRFVRALDQSDPSTAFLRLWSALESLTTPIVADYDKLIRRTCFLFSDHEYHRQVLEHLREYRNANVHAGEESDNAKIHCFQLQMYFLTAAWFFIHNATRFSSLEEAGEFLDLPPGRSELLRRLELVKGALKFTAPSVG